MKITSLDQASVYYIETDENEYPSYRRLSKDSWEVLMGESWEPAYGQESELEALFREFTLPGFVRHEKQRL